MVRLIFDEYTDRDDLTPQQRWKLRNPKKSVQNSIDSARKRKLTKPEAYLHYIVRGSAKQRDMQYLISIEDVVIPEKCPILGIPLRFPEKGFSDGTPSIDRIDNNKDYVPSNIRVISRRANTLKSNMSISEVRSLLKYMEDNEVLTYT